MKSDADEANEVAHRAHLQRLRPGPPPGDPFDTLDFVGAGLDLILLEGAREEMDLGALRVGARWITLRWA